MKLLNMHASAHTQILIKATIRWQPAGHSLAQLLAILIFGLISRQCAIAVPHQVLFQFSLRWPMCWVMLKNNKG